MNARGFGLTDVGRCRETNQDELLVEPGLGLFAVADGMGGHAAGEVASRLAIESLAQNMRSAAADAPTRDADAVARDLERAFREGNRRICESVVERGEWRGMGTTLVAVVTVGNLAVIGHVGDSRAYRLRDGLLTRLTSDHSWVNEQVKLGLLTDEEAHRHPMRNIVTRALGNRPELQVDISREELRAGDVLLLCSDGLNSMLGDEEIRETLADFTSRPEGACSRLVERANARGGDDNITVVVVTCGEG